MACESVWAPGTRGGMACPAVHEDAVKTVLASAPICEQCGERAAVLIAIETCKRWCDECWRWRWADVH